MLYVAFLSLLVLASSIHRDNDLGLIKPVQIDAISGIEVAQDGGAPPPPPPDGGSGSGGYSPTGYSPSGSGDAPPPPPPDGGSGSGGYSPSSSDAPPPPPPDGGSGSGGYSPSSSSDAPPPPPPDGGSGSGGYSPTGYSPSGSGDAPPPPPPDGGSGSGGYSPTGYSPSGSGDAPPPPPPDGGSGSGGYSPSGYSPSGYSPSGYSPAPTIPERTQKIILPPSDLTGLVSLSALCSDSLASRFATPQAYNIFGYSGSVYISGSTSPAGIANTASDATPLYVVPAETSKCTSRALQYGQEFYLVTINGQYLQRFQRISTETPSDKPHQSARFSLGFSATPSQTWRVDYTGNGSVPNSKNVGITIAGKGSDWTLPNNNIRRTLTLRGGDGISVVVQWWQSDEQIAFKGDSPVTSAATCSSVTPFLVKPIIDRIKPVQPLPPTDLTGLVSLSPLCSDSLAFRFASAQAYNIFGYSGNVYISGSSSPAGITTTASAATPLYVVPVDTSKCTSRALQYGQEFYLVTINGQYLQRFQRISTETPSDKPHQSARFSLGFSATPSQTWRVDYTGNGNVPSSKNVGITIAGKGSDWTSPDNNIRRTLTLRGGDGISVVVQWWQSDEQIAFKGASPATTAATCSSVTPFSIKPVQPIQPLAPVDLSKFVLLSGLCSDVSLGAPQPYNVFGYSGNVYISGSTSPAGITTNVNSATTLFVIPAASVKSRVLQYGQDFYLVNLAGQYLERNQRISTETPKDQPHASARFSLGFFPKPSQTWQVSYNGTGNVPNNAHIGLTIGGTGTDWTLPNNNIRRSLTLRGGDGISVVVQWWQSDEQIAFKVDTTTSGAGPCSAPAPVIKTQKTTNYSPY